MPIPNLTDETPINQYTANSGETEFAFTFYIFALSDIKVYANDVLKTITTDYVVRKNDGTAIGDADLPMDGGKIIFNVGRTAGEKISLNRDIPVDRSTQFSTGGAFKADSLNSELTRILTIAQQLKRDVARSFRLAPSDAEGGSLQLPTDRADNILAFDSNSNLILTKFADIDKANVSPFMATLLDDVSASIARGTLNAQELNANLTALAGLNGSANKIPYFNGVGSMALADRAYQFLNLRVFTSSTTYTPTSGTRAILVKLVGGGGGGAGSNASTVAVGGGGGGGGAESFLTTFSSTVSITVGAGGAAGSNSNGGNGGATSFGSYLSATGGSGGTMGSGNGSVGGIGTVSSGNGFAVAGSGGGTGQSRIFSGAANGDGGGNGGNSMLGGGGNGGNYSGTVGGAGDIGGGGGSALTTGGAGGPGIVLVYEFN